MQGFGLRMRSEMRSANFVEEYIALWTAVCALSCAGMIERTYSCDIAGVCISGLTCIYTSVFVNLQQQNTGVTSAPTGEIDGSHSEVSSKDIGDERVKQA